MVMHRDNYKLEHISFQQILEYLKPGDVLVLNTTRVIPARVYARKDTGGEVEILLLRRLDLLRWEALVGGKRMSEGRKLTLNGGIPAEVEEVLDGSRRIIRFAEPVEPHLGKIGHMPLPPYIHEPLQDPEQYQTVYSRELGSAAAPTAGLHFTTELMDQICSAGVRIANVTLHVGLDTFAPVTEADPETHQIHTEWCEVTSTAAETINQTAREGGRVFAVGTTSVRTLESAAKAARGGDRVAAISGPTNLFILPGYHFKSVDAMITNFHLPKSTLLMLVSAFAGREQILSAYQEAIRLNYRFYSFGDAMLIL
mgnify:FL=1